mmetsp:Transcript_8905/g.25461  ORF Transcript_8905/g.25461 Transcript_8905/m.25461 type:complete len:379 (-) Transcript_8905:32-1168(-)
MALPRAQPHVTSAVSTIGIIASAPICGIEWGAWHYDGALFYIFLALGLLALFAPRILASVYLLVAELLGFRIRPRIRPSDSPSSVLTTMQLHFDDPKIQMDGLRSLLASAINEPSKESLLRLGVFRHTVEVLEVYQKYPPLVLRGLQLLLAFVSLPAAKVVVEERGSDFVAPIVRAMQFTLDQDRENQEQADLSTQEEAGLAETKGCTQEEGSQDASLRGRMAKASADVQRVGCMVIGALADGSNDIKTMVVDEGFLQLALEVLHWYQLHEGVSEWVLWSIFNTTFAHASNKVELHRKGGLVDVISAMKRFQDALRVQQHGMGILYNCLMVDVKLDVSSMRKAALSHGLKAALESAVEKHGTAKIVESMATAMLREVH